MMLKKVPMKQIRRIFPTVHQFTVNAEMRNPEMKAIRRKSIPELSCKMTRVERLSCVTRGYDVIDSKSGYLGGGASGRVFMARVQKWLLAKNPRLNWLYVKERKKSPLEVAVKIIYVDVGHEELARMCKYLPSEIHNLNRLLGQSNILRMVDVFVSCKRVFIVTEFTSKGSLLHLKMIIGDEKRMKQIFRQIVQGVNSMHNMQISHRDLKLDNILLTEADQVKIADFGLSVDLTNHEDDCDVTNITKTLCGTPLYVAPEVFVKGRVYDAKAADIWSLGVILFVLLNGKFPFAGDTIDKIKSEHEVAEKRELKFTQLSPEAIKLVYGCLRINPCERLTSDQILRHPWLTCDGTFPSTRENKLDCELRMISNLHALDVEKIIRNYLTQRYRVLKNTARLMTSHYTTTMRKRCGVEIALPRHQSTGHVTEEIWRIFSPRKQTPHDEVTRHRLSLNTKVTSPTEVLGCKRVDVTSSFTQSTLYYVFTLHPGFMESCTSSAKSKVYYDTIGSRNDDVIGGDVNSRDVIDNVILNIDGSIRNNQKSLVGDKSRHSLDGGDRDVTQYFKLHRIRYKAPTYRTAKEIAVKSRAVVKSSPADELKNMKTKVTTTKLPNPIDRVESWMTSTQQRQKEGRAPGEKLLTKEGKMQVPINNIKEDDDDVTYAPAYVSNSFENIWRRFERKSRIRWRLHQHNNKPASITTNSFISTHTAYDVRKAVKSTAAAIGGWFGASFGATREAVQRVPEAASTTSFKSIITSVQNRKESAIKVTTVMTSSSSDIYNTVEEGSSGGEEALTSYHPDVTILTSNYLSSSYVSLMSSSPTLESSTTDLFSNIRQRAHSCFCDGDHPNVSCGIGRDPHHQQCRVNDVMTSSIVSTSVSTVTSSQLAYIDVSPELRTSKLDFRGNRNNGDHPRKLLYDVIDTSDKSSMSCFGGCILQ